MKKLLGVLAGMIALALPSAAQNARVPTTSYRPVAWQDRDHDRKHDRDHDRDDRGRHRGWGKHDRDHDRDDRWRGRDRDGDHDRDDRWRRDHRWRDRDGDGDRDDRGRNRGFWPNRNNGNYGWYGNNRGYGRYGSYRGVLAPEYQRRFDSYYTRWLRYRATNNYSEVASMENRMRDIMANYRIPLNTPYGQIASPGLRY